MSGAHPSLVRSRVLLALGILGLGLGSLLFGFAALLFVLAVLTEEPTLFRAMATLIGLVGISSIFAGATCLRRRKRASEPDPTSLGSGPSDNPFETHRRTP